MLRYLSFLFLFVSTFGVKAQLGGLISGGGSSSITLPLLSLSSSTNQVLNFSAGIYQTITLTNSTTFTATNLAKVRTVTLIVNPGTTNRNVSFPTNWVWIGMSAPTSVSSNKVMIVTATALGTNATNVIASYATQY